MDERSSDLYNRFFQVVLLPQVESDTNKGENGAEQGSPRRYRILGPHTLPYSCCSFSDPSFVSCINDLTFPLCMQLC